VPCTHVCIGSSETSASENGRKVEQAQAIHKVARASGLRRKTLDIIPAHTQASVPTNTQGGGEGPDNNLAAEAVLVDSLSPPIIRGGWGARVEGAGVVSSSFAYDAEADLTVSQREGERLLGTVLHNGGPKASSHHVFVSSLPTKSPSKPPPHVTQDAAVTNTQRSSSSHTHTVSTPLTHPTTHTHIVSTPVFPPSPPFPATRPLYSSPRATLSHDVLGGWGLERGARRRETELPHRLAHVQWDSDEDEKVFYSSGPNGEA
jgi:hypothetical protein